MSSLLVFNRVYRLEIQSVMVGIFDSLTLSPPPLLCVNKYRGMHLYSGYYTLLKNNNIILRLPCLCKRGGGGDGQWACVDVESIQELYTVYFPRLGTYKDR